MDASLLRKPFVLNVPMAACAWSCVGYIPKSVLFLSGMLASSKDDLSTSFSRGATRFRKPANANSIIGKESAR
jgi:hypothetical protein